MFAGGASRGVAGRPTAALVLECHRLGLWPGSECYEDPRIRRWDDGVAGITIAVALDATGTIELAEVSLELPGCSPLHGERILVGPHAPDVAAEAIGELTRIALSVPAIAKLLVKGRR